MGYIDPGGANSGQSVFDLCTLSNDFDVIAVVSIDQEPDFKRRCEQGNDPSIASHAILSVSVLSEIRGKLAPSNVVIASHGGEFVKGQKMLIMGDFIGPGVLGVQGDLGVELFPDSVQAAKNTPEHVDLPSSTSEIRTALTSSEDHCLGTNRVFANRNDRMVYYQADPSTCGKLGVKPSDSTPSQNPDDSSEDGR